MSDVPPGRRARRHAGTTGPAGPRRRGRCPGPAVAVVLLVLAAAGAGGYLYVRQVSRRPPSPAQLVALLKETRAKTTELSCVIRVPWPEAHSAVSGLPGARALLAPADGQRAFSVRWRAGAGMRVEVIEPSEAAGSLTVYDGLTWWTHSPVLNLTLAAVAPVPPLLFLDELLAMVDASAERRVLGRSGVGGDRTFELSCVLPDASELRLDIDRSVGVPLRARRFDAGGRLLGMLEVSDLNLSPGIEAAEFAFTPPAGSRIVMESLPRQYGSLADAAAQLPFTPRTPTQPPKGFELTAVNLVGTGTARALVLTYTRTAGDGPEGLFTLTMTLAGTGWKPLPYGRPEQRGMWQGQVFELGGLSGVDWRSGDLALTLFGTIAASELVNVAVSIP